MKYFALAWTLTLSSIPLFAQTTTVSYSQISCERGQLPSTLQRLDGATKTELSSSVDPTFKEVFSMVNQGRQESYEFVSLGLQYRTTTTNVGAAGTLRKVTKVFGHLVGSPLGIPKSTRGVAAIINPDGTMQVEVKVWNGLFFLMENAQCIYRPI